MRPMLGRKIIEGKEDFFIFLEAFAGFWEFDLVTGHELPEPLCGSAPDQLLGLALNAFGHFIQDVYRLRHPAPLLATGPYSSCRAIQKPSEPSPMASFGGVVSPRRLSCPSSSRQD